MKCPHCLESFHDDPKEVNLALDKNGLWRAVTRICPSCKNAIFHLSNGEHHGQTYHRKKADQLFYPNAISRTPLPPEVDQRFAEDYKEACIVLSDSPKASAALSRRCLQLLLREKAGIKSGDLYSEIQELLDKNSLPAHISESIDAIRHIGNFATHPIKSKSSGVIVEVESGEAEWNLDVLEMLFDFYFVQPERTRQKRAALDKKLVDAGKSPMKS